LYEDASGATIFKNSNGWLYDPKTGNKKAIKINTGADSKVTITDESGTALYSGFGGTPTNHDANWL
jgi:hypothetical protein